MTVSVSEAQPAQSKHVEDDRTRRRLQIAHIASSSLAKVTYRGGRKALTTGPPGPLVIIAFVLLAL